MRTDSLEMLEEGEDKEAEDGADEDDEKGRMLLIDSHVLLVLRADLLNPKQSAETATKDSMSGEDHSGCPAQKLPKRSQSRFPQRKQARQLLEPHDAGYWPGRTWLPYQSGKSKFH